jgi:hypothetical protein
MLSAEPSILVFRQNHHSDELIVDRLDLKFAPRDKSLCRINIEEDAMTYLQGRQRDNYNTSTVSQGNLKGVEHLTDGRHARIQVGSVADIYK